MVEMERQQHLDEHRAAEQRKRDLNLLADAFESTVGGVVGSVTAQTDEMRSNAQDLSTIAEEASRQTIVVAAAADQASTNVHTVAAAAEELARSIDEINERIVHSSQMALEAVDEVGKANGTMTGLASSAQKIGDVVSLIQNIAGQTNLLALNATIEAARERAKPERALPLSPRKSRTSPARRPGPPRKSLRRLPRFRRSAVTRSAPSK